MASYRTEDLTTSSRYYSATIDISIRERSSHSHLRYLCRTNCLPVVDYSLSILCPSAMDIYFQSYYVIVTQSINNLCGLQRPVGQPDRRARRRGAAAAAVAAHAVSAAAHANAMQSTLSTNDNKNSRLSTQRRRGGSSLTGRSTLARRHFGARPKSCILPPQ